ncbi:MAG: molybdenum cofactor guanylyltransferase [Sphingopyxis sp.]
MPHRPANPRTPAAPAINTAPIATPGRDQRLGALLAGGQSRRFGSDKADHIVAGRTLRAHTIGALAGACGTVIICGPPVAGHANIADEPMADMGPLGGLNAALAHAARHGFAGVLCAPVDVFPLPGNLADALVGAGPAVFARQYLVGYWPVACGPALDAYLRSGQRAVRGWLDAAQPRLVAEPAGLLNINRLADAPPQ